MLELTISCPCSWPLAPQIGMFGMDRDWVEEMAMLRMAIAHVNRLQPRFLLVSGDLTNAWPSAKTEDLVKRQRASFQEAMRELDPGTHLSLEAHSLSRLNSHALPAKPLLHILPTAASAFARVVSLLDIHLTHA